MPPRPSALSISLSLELRLVTQAEKSITAKVPVNPLNIYSHRCFNGWTFSIKVMHKNVLLIFRPLMLLLHCFADIWKHTGKNIIAAAAMASLLIVQGQQV